MLAALGPEGIIITTVLNKIGLLAFAYLNSMLVARLVLQRRGVAAIEDALVTDGND